jgi:hypothetical protein
VRNSAVPSAEHPATNISTMAEPGLSSTPADYYHLACPIPTLKTVRVSGNRAQIVLP